MLNVAGALYTVKGIMENSAVDWKITGWRS